MPEPLIEAAGRQRGSHKVAAVIRLAGIMPIGGIVFVRHWHRRLLLPAIGLIRTLWVCR